MTPLEEYFTGVGEFDDYLHSGEEVKALASPETELHETADKHFADLSVAVRYAFAAGRKAVARALPTATTVDEVERIMRQALVIVKRELLAVLPGALDRVYQASGKTGMAMLLTKLRTLGGKGSGHFGHKGRPGEVGGSGPGESEVAKQKQLAAKHEHDSLANPSFVLGLHARETQAAIRYVGAYGEHFESAPLPSIIRRGVPKECYKNASLLVMENPELDFVEGFAKTPSTGELVFAHAWAVDRELGTVIDNTWDNPEECQYFGVRYDRKAYLKYLYTAKIYGVLGSTPQNSAKAIATGGKGLRKETEHRALAKDDLFTISFDVTNKRAAKWAKKHAAKLAKDLTGTSEKAIQAAISKVFKGKAFKEAYAEILDAIGDETRADVIARTEIMTAASEGQREAWAQAVDRGLLDEDALRVWITVDGACPECAALEGTTAELGGTYAGGEVGPPLHPNCRCTEGIQ